MWGAGIVVLMKRAGIASRAIPGPETKLQLGELGAHRSAVGQGPTQRLGSLQASAPRSTTIEARNREPAVHNPILQSIPDPTPGASAGWAGGLVELQTVLC